MTPQLPDTTLTREATNTARHDAMSTDTYELPDKTIASILDSDCLSGATNSITSKRPDETLSSLPIVKPLPDATTYQLPDVTVAQVISDEAETLNQMEFEATVEYPVSEHVNESVTDMANTSVKTNNTNLNTPVTSETVENEDNLLLENNLDLDRSNSVNSGTDASNLKKCIIKLTDLSAEERNKWLGLTDKSSVSNLSTDSNSSRYYM